MSFVSRRFAVLASLFLAVSPSLTFFSRYAIHETLFSTLTLSFSVGILLWFCRGSRVGVYLAIASVAGLICTKETWIISVFCVALATLSLTNPKKLVERVRRDWGHFVIAFIGLIFFVAVVFSAGFVWFDGLREMLLAIPQWVSRNSSDIGHHKPFWYYLKVIISTERHLLDLFLILIAVVLYRSVIGAKPFFDLGESRVARFLLVWGVSSLIVYSAIAYKTPWLIINITLPLILLASWWLDRFMKMGRAQLVLGTFLTIILLLASIGNTFRYNFNRIKVGSQEKQIPGAVPYGNGNPFSYVHTHKGMLTLLDDIQTYREKLPTVRI
ncbi:MAG: hypothetical protein KDD53_12590, partial [Bdellovibrionales bacterium]|nr:hypothetical protein [Bdellovibrionales bacterium]